MRSKNLMILVGAGLLALCVSGPALSQGSSPLNDAEKALMKTEENVIDVQRQLSAARKRGDAKQVKALQKKFDKTQKKRIGLLRSTWQM